MVDQESQEKRDQARRLARWCFRGALFLAAALAGVVLAAPWVAGRWPTAVPRWLELLAADQAVRRAMVVAAVGLWLTALVWFRGTRASAFKEQSS